MNLSEKDQLYHWHPYTQHKTAGLLPAIVKGQGALLWDENGKEYIDAISSWWVNPYGHSNSYMAEAIYKQLTTLEHVLFGGFTNKPAVLLSERLFEILPDNQKKIFFSDNGSTAVEVALKAALQYYYNKGQKRTQIIAFEDAFHGDTFGAMASSGITFFTEAFKESLIDVIRIPVPIPGKESETKRALLAAVETNTCAAFIFEPLVQGAAGMVMYASEILDELMAICQKRGVFCIADEVMTGFGKTGKTFACNHLAEKPDMMCLSKALTGGTIPMAITTFAQEIYDGFFDDDINKALFHGHTFTANPTGCAAALAALDLLQSPGIQQDILRLHHNHLQFEARIKSHPKVKSTRVLGVIMALEIVTEGQESYYGTLRNKLYRYFIEHGVILRPIGATVYVLPPYIIEDQQLEKVYALIESALEIV